MVERYNTYCTWAHNRSTGREICPGGEHVLATDYAALEAERDEWKRKHDEVNENYMGLVNLILPHLRAAQERAAAIAEVQDNG